MRYPVHRLSENQNNLNPNRCHYPLITYLTPRDFSNHHKEKHLFHHWQIFLCDLCDYHTEKKLEVLKVEEQSIVNHMKNEHGVDDFRPYKCDQCDYAAQARSIKRGVSNRHPLG